MSQANQASSRADTRQPGDDNDEHRDHRPRLDESEEETASRPHKNDSHLSSDTIDELDSRVIRPLPSRRIMPEPHPSDHVRNPTHTEEYPYGKLTKSAVDTLAKKPSGYGINFTDHAFPRPFVATPLLLKNMKDYQRQQVLESSGEVLALVPYGAGPRWEAKHGPRALVAIRDWLLQVEFSDKGKCQVSMAEAQSNKDRRDFGNPWSIILYDISSEFREWLLDLGVVALSEPGATFMIHSFDEGKMSWVLLNFIGPAVEEGEEERYEALVEIKTKIFKDSSIREVVRQLVASQAGDQEHTSLARKTNEQILELLTSSFRIIFIPCKDPNGEAKPRYQLHGKPISSNKELQRKWVMAIRGIKYNVRFKPLYPDKGDFGCVWCKGEDHPGHACPYPDHSDEKWLGPTKEQLTSIMNNPSDWKKKEHSTTAEQLSPAARGRGHFRGGRGFDGGMTMAEGSRGRGSGRGNGRGYQRASPFRGRGYSRGNRGTVYPYQQYTYTPEYSEGYNTPGWE
ncbi:hypothetical protein GGU11DRAFT_745009 [Lentinula aff. detonsa]|nr:hypothetical protein GGU11DRAFT_745009 [Lentinula aff. detonsa]